MNRDKFFDHVMLAGFLGVCSYGVAKMEKMSNALEKMTISMVQLNDKMGFVYPKVERHEQGFLDHEQRLRTVEKDKDFKFKRGG